MSEMPTWHLDLDLAIGEANSCFGKWQSQMDRLRELVRQHETYAPDAFTTPLLQMMPEFRRATLAAIARLQIMAQIKSGEMRCREDAPEGSAA
jgi:hypothetical protein